MRNAANVIVQTNYGDDGMDPVCMEGSAGEPVALPRMLSIVKHRTAPARELAPLPADLRRVMGEELAAMLAMEPSSGRAGLDEAAQPSGSGGSAFCTQKFTDSLAGFLNDQVQPSMHSAPLTFGSFGQKLLNLGTLALTVDTCADAKACTRCSTPDGSLGIVFVLLAGTLSVRD